MSPFAATWLAMQLPHLILAGSWALVLRHRNLWVTVAGIVVLLGWVALNAAEVLSGGLPDDGTVWPVQVRWATLALALAVSRESRSYQLGSLTFAGMAALAEAWLPVVVLVGRGSVETTTWLFRAGLFAFLGVGLVRQHAWLEVSALFGGLGLSMDATTVVALGVLGGVEAVAWGAMFGSRSVR